MGKERGGGGVVMWYHNLALTESLGKFVLFALNFVSSSQKSPIPLRAVCFFLTLSNNVGKFSTFFLLTCT